MESKKINQLATEMTPTGSDLTIIGDPITGVSRKITLLQLSATIGTGADLQGVTDNGATTTNPIAIGGLTITGLATGVLKSDSGVISSVPFGAANGVATLGGDGKVPSIQLPSYVDDVVEVANFAALPVTGETGKIYITLDNNKVYRWTGSTYVEIAANNAVWGAITGTLSNQTDLQNALNLKANDNAVVHLAGTETITGSKTFSATTIQDAGIVLKDGVYPSPSTGYVGFASNGVGITIVRRSGGTSYNNNFQFPLASNDYNFPDATGTIALLEGTQTFSGAKTFTQNLALDGNGSNAGTLLLKSNTVMPVAIGYASINNNANIINLITYVSQTKNAALDLSGLSDNITRTFTFPNASGTIALTSNLSSYVPYTGATGSVNLGEFDLTSRYIFSNGSGTAAGLISMKIGNTITATSGYGTIGAASGQQFVFNSFVSGSYSKTAYFNFSSLTDNVVRSYTFPNADGTVALTSDLSGYVTLATAQNISGFKTFTALATNNEAVGIKLTSGVVSTEGYLTLNAKVVGTLHSLFLAPDSTTNRAEITFDNTALRTYALPNVSGTIALTSNLSAYLPLAGGTLTGGLIGTTGSFSSSGGSDTFAINHSSGSGIALNITKGGNGEGLYINKTSGSGNAATIIGTLNATTLVKSGGTSSQYLMADGSVSTLTNPVTGTGTTNYLPKFTGASTIGNSQIFDNGTNVGIGTTSNLSGKLTVNGGFAIGNGWGTSGATLEASTGATGTDGATIEVSYWGTSSYGSLFLKTGNAIRATLNASGNLGLGVTPSAWSGYTAFQNAGGSLIGTTGELQLWQNAYYNGTSSIYINSSTATRYNMVGGQHRWYNAPSGTAGNAITFTQAMTLDASGNLIVGGTSALGSASGRGNITVNGSSTSILSLGTAGVWSGYMFHDSTNMTVSNVKSGSLFLATGDVTRLTIASTGAATFSSSVSVATFLRASAGAQSNPTGGASVAIDYQTTSDIQGRIRSRDWDGAAWKNLTIEANNIILSPTGNVGIGTTSPSALFHTAKSSSGEVARFSAPNGSIPYILIGRPDSAAEGMKLTYDSNTGDTSFEAVAAHNMLFKNNNIERMRITSGGVITIANLAGTGSRAVLADASGNLSAPVSDISVKQNITSIGYGLNEILKMNPVWFDFIDDYKNYGEERQNGMIAQEVAEVIPEAVFTTPSTGKMGINYDQLHAVYIKAIQELKAEIEILKNK
jgi:hypothetical protein